MSKKNAREIRLGNMRFLSGPARPESNVAARVRDAGAGSIASDITRAEANARVLKRLTDAGAGQLASALYPNPHMMPTFPSGAPMFAQAPAAAAAAAYNSNNNLRRIISGYGGPPPAPAPAAKPKANTTHSVNNFFAKGGKRNTRKVRKTKTRRVK